MIKMVTKIGRTKIHAPKARNINPTFSRKVNISFVSELLSIKEISFYISLAQNQFRV